MGHPRHAEAPSPIQMLAIMAAKQSGTCLRILSKQTGYSHSTIMRWWVKWGRESAIFMESIANETPDLVAGKSFDDLYPKKESGPA